MTQPERRKVPPIVPKKKKSLYNLRNDDAAEPSPATTILLPKLKAREEPAEEQNPQVNVSLEKLVESISLDAEYVVHKPRKDEPRAITFESVMKPTIRNDIRLGGHFHIRTVETPLEKQLRSVEENSTKHTSPPPPPVKPKPKIAFSADTQHKQKPTIKPKPKPKPSLLAKATSNFSASDDNTPDFLRDAMKKRLQLSQGIPLPGLAKVTSFTPASTTTSTTTPLSSTYRQVRAPLFLSSPLKSHTIDNGSLEKRGRPLVHPNKRRAKGPKRRLPSELSSSTSSSLSSSSSSSLALPSSSASSIPASTSVAPLRHKHKTPPPIRKPSKAIVIHS